LAAETIVVKHYEFSRTRQAYREDSELFDENGRYRGFSYYSWTKWENPFNKSMLRIYGIESIEELGREEAIKAVINGYDPRELLSPNGGVRVRKVTTTTTTESTEDSIGNFRTVNSVTVEALVIYEEIITKEFFELKQAAQAEEERFHEEAVARNRAEAEARHKAETEAREEASAPRRSILARMLSR